MPFRLLLAVAIPLLGALYLLQQNPSQVPLQIFPGKTWSVPLVLIILASALAGALLTALWDLAGHLRGHWLMRRFARRQDQAEAYYRSGLAALEKADLGRAARAFRRALKRRPLYVEALCELGNLKRGQGHLEEAVRLHRQALAAANDSLPALEGLALDYSQAEQPEALKTLCQEVRHQPQAEALLLLKLREYYIGRQAWEEAAKTQEALLALPGRPRDKKEEELYGHLLFEKGRGHLQAGEWEEAIRTLRRVARHSVPARVALGDAYERSGQIRRALRLWRQGFERTQALIFLERMEHLFRSQARPDKVPSLYRWALKRHPQDLWPRLALAQLALRQGHPEAALEELRSFRGGDGHLAAHILRGLAHLDLGDAVGARGSLGEALDVLWDPEGRYRCTACGRGYPEWRGRCEGCGRWATVDPANSWRLGEGRRLGPSKEDPVSGTDGLLRV